MDLIDLHIHSNASDGSLTPSEVANEAINAGLKAIALTDHDTVKGIGRAIAHARKIGDISVIAGTELSCYAKNREVHILGLNIKNSGGYAV